MEKIKKQLEKLSNRVRELELKRKELLLDRTESLVESYQDLRVKNNSIFNALQMCERARVCGQIEKIDKVILQKAIELAEGE